MKVIQTPRAKPHFHWTHIRTTHQIIAISIMFHFSLLQKGAAFSVYRYSRSRSAREACTFEFIHRFLSSSSSSTFNNYDNETMLVRVGVPDMTGWTVDRVVTESIIQLQAQNVTEPESSVSQLLAASLQLSWKTGYREISSRSLNSHTLQQYQAKEYADKLSRRLQHEPLQYILGQWDFLDYTVKIRPPLLCPRPETEELVMRIIQDTTESPIHILDVGCGTGVIGLALAEQLPDAFVQAIDIDPVAIETSLENAMIVLGNQDYANSCYAATLCSAQDYQGNHKFDIVVSNPPYIPKADMVTLSRDVAEYESESALCGGDDGMDIVRVICQKLPTWCHSSGICWMEVDPTHPKLLKEWLDENPSLGVVFEESYQDMFGKDRFVKLRVV
jgi:release factor glutamine methyltransferase